MADQVATSTGEFALKMDQAVTEAIAEAIWRVRAHELSEAVGRPPLYRLLLLNPQSRLQPILLQPAHGS